MVEHRTATKPVFNASTLDHWHLPLEGNMISQEGVSERLGSMLAEIRASSADRVRHEAAIIIDDMNRLGPISNEPSPAKGETLPSDPRVQQGFELSKVQAVQTLVEEALALFEQQQQRLAEACLIRAIEYWAQGSRPK